MVRIKLWLSREVQGFFLRLKSHPLKAERLPEQPNQIRPSLMLVKCKSVMVRVVRNWSAKGNEDLVSRNPEIYVLAPCDSGTLRFTTEMSHCPLEIPLNPHSFLRKELIIQSERWNYSEDKAKWFCKDAGVASSFLPWLSPTSIRLSGQAPPGCLHVTRSVLARGQVLLLQYILGLIIHWKVQILPVTNILEQTLFWYAELIIC